MDANLSALWDQLREACRRLAVLQDTVRLMRREITELRMKIKDLGGS